MTTTEVPSTAEGASATTADTSATTYTRASAVEAVVLELVGHLGDRTLLPYGHHLAYGDHHFSDPDSDSLGVVELEAFTEAGATRIRITVEAV